MHFLDGRKDGSGGGHTLRFPVVDGDEFVHDFFVLLLYLMGFLVFVVHFGIFEFGDAGAVGEVGGDEGVLAFHAVAVQLVGPSSQKWVPEMAIKFKGIIIHDTILII